MAVTVDGVKQEEMPTNPQGENGQYYKVDVSCGSSRTEGLWDYNAWRLNLDYIDSNSKCNLTFTSNMSKADYDEYIKAGVALRRNTYRGKDITKYYTGDEKVNNRNLFEQISNCTFDDIYVGDYIKTNNGGNNVTWLIADLNNYLGTGLYKPVDLSVRRCHATIIPLDFLEYGAQMNDKDTTGVADSQLKLTDLENKEVSDVGAYMGSKMKQTTLPMILEKYIKPVFNEHIIKYSSLLSDKIDTTRTSSLGVESGGVSSHYSWYESYLDLMNEVEVFGYAVAANIYDIGVENQQYAIFRLNPDIISGETYWLRTVINSTTFLSVSNISSLNTANASVTWAGVRPRFLID